jgi:lipopolysaccharide transport system ATP-binding protein
MHAIEVSHLTKEYRLGALQSLKQTAANAGARLLGRDVPRVPLFKALNDVSFTVAPGEVVGVIGHNGAGKSTLLKMLSRISTPTSGSVKVNGRVAPLIEVGAATSRGAKTSTSTAPSWACRRKKSPASSTRSSISQKWPTSSTRP